jgi:hypothetical protein
MLVVKHHEAKAREKKRMLYRRTLAVEKPAE